MITKQQLTIDDLPSPKSTLILGHVKEFSVDNKHQIVEKWVHEHGELIQIRFLNKRIVVSANPNINKEILKRRPEKFRRFHKIDEVLTEMGVTGVFNAEGSTWKTHRLITSEALNLKNIKSYFPIIKSVTERLKNKWDSLTTIDIQKEMMRYTVDITSEIAFGYPMNTLEDDNDTVQKHLEKIFPMINSRIVAPIPIWRYIKSKKDKDLDYALSEVEKVVLQFIAKGKEKMKANPDLKNNPSNFLEALLSEQQKDPSFTDKDVFGNVFTMLLAGEDTTSNSISWAIYFLTEHPEIRAKVKEEVDSYCEGFSFPQTYEVMKKMKYTEAVAMETLRIKPVTPMLYFEALEDQQIENFSFKKGTTFMLQNKVAQTSEDYFSQPNEFKPERWLKSCPFSGNHKPSMMHTFGAGPRFCPGKNLAIHEMVMAISMFCSNFNPTFAIPKEKIEEVFSFTMYPSNLMIKVR